MKWISRISLKIQVFYPVNPENPVHPVNIFTGLHIDAPVYDLYSLTEEKIRMVEGQVGEVSP